MHKSALHIALMALLVGLFAAWIGEQRARAYPFRAVFPGRDTLAAENGGPAAGRDSPKPAASDFNSLGSRPATANSGSDSPAAGLGADSLAPQAATSAVNADTPAQNSGQAPVPSTLNGLAASSDNLSVVAATPDSISSIPAVHSDSFAAASPDSASLPAASPDSLAAATSDSLRIRSLLQDSTISGIESLRLVMADSLGYDSRRIDSLLRDSLWMRSMGLDSIFAPKVYSKAELRALRRDSTSKVRAAAKDRRDSIRWSIPRILTSTYIPDSVRYTRMFAFNSNKYVNEYRPAKIDTTINEWYTEYPYAKEDVNATTLGPVGSATLYYNYFKRAPYEQFKAFEPYISWSYTPETMLQYNTKAPYTVLAYWGTLFNFQNQEEINVRFIHTQNITPKLNLSFQYFGYQMGGYLVNENTHDKTLIVGGNYLGRKYVAQAGFIHQRVTRTENGGIRNLSDFRDTTIDTKAIPVNLSSAKNQLVRDIVYLKHSYGIPFRFGASKARKEKEAALRELGHIADSLAVLENSSSVELGVNEGIMDEINGVGSPEQIQARRDSLLALARRDRYVRDSLLAADTALIIRRDSLLAILRAPLDSADAARDSVRDGYGPMLSFGHNFEMSFFNRMYTDKITDDVGRNFYNNVFYLDPTSSNDSTRVFALENKVYVRLQPWARDAVVGHIDGGVGHLYQSIYGFSPSMYLSGNRNVNFNNLYVYALVGGKFRKYLEWGASGQYHFLGYYQNDFNIDANVAVSFYPFRNRKDPVTLRARFMTELREPDWYSQHYHSNHFWWDNSFGKTSNTVIQASVEIPKWKFDVSANYSLVKNMLYYDTLGIVRQHSDLMSILTVTLHKDFKVWWLRFDNNLMFQLSSNNDVLPLPMFSLHCRWYFEHDLVKNVLKMQLGVDGTWNLAYYAPAWNPALSTFQLQNREKIGSAPYIDLFANFQWRRITLFVKCTNVAMGAPSRDMFSAYGYIKPVRSFKIGIHWPFYIR